MNETTVENCEQCIIGQRIWFAEEKKPYRVRCRSDRYLICTKPANLWKTVFYTIIDLKENIRGAENVILGFGAETDEECQEMLDRLEGAVSPDPESDELLREMGIEPPPLTQTEVSYRNRVPLVVTRVS